MINLLVYSVALCEELSFGRIVMCAANFDFNSWAAILITLLYDAV